MKLDPGMVGSSKSETICILHDRYSWNWHEIGEVLEMYPDNVYHYYTKKAYAHRWNIKARSRRDKTEAQREKRRVTDRARRARKREERERGFIKV